LWVSIDTQTPALARILANNPAKAAIGKYSRHIGVAAHCWQTFSPAP
jgi:hypothetical protein